MSIKDKLHNKSLYICSDENLLKEQFSYMEKLYEFNQTRPHEL